MRRHQGHAEHPSIELHELSSVTSVDMSIKPQNDGSLIQASVKVNTILLIGKALATVMSSSPAILASLVDSAVDVLVQASLYWAMRAAGNISREYPIGRGQLEPVAVVVCAALKCAGMVAVLAESANLLIEADHDYDSSKHGWLHMSSHDVHKHGWLHIYRRHLESVLLLLLVSLIKLAFCTWCELAIRGRGITTETARAVIADNQNDCVLSVGALIATVVTQLSSK